MTDEEIDGQVATRRARKNGASHPPKSFPRKPVVEIADRLPPHSIEMEQGVLGCILTSPKECMEIVLEKIKGRDAFYDLRHQIIYSNLVEMFEAKIPIDIISLQQRLRDLISLDEVGGIPYLNSLQDGVPSASNLSYYLDVLIEKHTLRKIVKTCHEVSQKAYESSSQSDELLTVVERDIMGLNKPEIIPILDGRMMGNRMLEDLERRHALQGKLPGLDTGFVDLNRKTQGLQFGEQCIIGARPSQGKTALGVALFNHSVFNGVPSLFVSLEMSVEAIARRVLSARSEIPLERIKMGTYLEEDFAKFSMVRDQFNRAPMHFMDGIGGLGIRSICSRVRRHVLKFDIKLVVIDYLQKIKAAERHEKRTYEVGDISTRLKALAVESNIALVTLAQLSREAVSKNQNNQSSKPPQPPKLSDFADSGQIERDADLALLLQKEPDYTRVIIAKQRDGETGAIRLRFNGPLCRFENAAWD
jgi:replicative DNA helicase